MAEPYNLITEYRIHAETDSPLHIGSWEGGLEEVLVHPLTDLPFIQASGLAGALRQASERVNGPEMTGALFGSSMMGKDDTPEDRASRIRVTDAVFQKDSLPMEFRPRVSINSFSGTVNEGDIKGSGRRSGHKFGVELTGSGAAFSFCLYLYHHSSDGLQEALERILGELRNGQIQFGGQKSNGSGFVRIREIRRKSFNMLSGRDREDWIKEGDLDSGWGEDILATLPDVGERMFAFRFHLKGRTEGSLLVRGIELADIGRNKAVGINIKNSDGACIIPGSSVKGALRSRAEILAGLLGKESILSEVFGEAGAGVGSVSAYDNALENISGEESGGASAKGRVNSPGNGRGKRGQLVVKDVIVGRTGEQIRELMQYRIHIDKFTGGVIDRGLFAEKAVSGVLEISIGIYPGKNAAAAAGLLLLTLRDLAAGAFNLGSGYNIGRGFISADSLRITGSHDALLDKAEKRNAGRDDCPEAEIDFRDGSISDRNGLISQCLRALDEWKEAD